MKIITLASFLFAFISASANASLITIETRALQTAKLDTTDFSGSWLDMETTISTNVIAEYANRSSGNNSFSHLSIEINIANNGSWAFDAGLDAGYGAAIYLDGVLLELRRDNLWWQHRWDHSDVISADNIALTQGTHTFDIYWAENCCNGSSSIRFSPDEGSSWSTLSNDTLTQNTVPEPETAIIFTLALMGLGFTQRRKR